jgi:glycosyltransferase involved in cell wall biosynthesis
MKIAFLSTFYPFRGGIAQFNGALYRALENEHEVKAFNFSLQYPKALFPGKTQFVDENDEVEKIPTDRVLNAMNPATYLTTVKKIKAFQPDILIIGYWMPYMAPSLGYVAGKMQKHCKVISIVHNAVPHEKGVMDKSLSNYFFKRNKHCIALSEAVQKDIAESYPKVKVKVLHHPTYNHFGELIKKEEALNFLKLDSKVKYLLFFGLIRDYKGLDLLLKTMPLIDEELHLVVAGEVYGEFQKYQEIIDNNKLKGRVHLHLKYIPDNEVKYYFSIAEAVVLPYKSATQSGIIAVAKHFDIPVVTTDVGGLREFIKDPSDGFVVENNTPKEIAKGIEEVISNKQTTTSEHKNGLSWEKFAEQLLEV